MPFTGSGEEVRCPGRSCRNVVFSVSIHTHLWSPFQTRDTGFSNTVFQYTLSETFMADIRGFIPPALKNLHILHPTMFFFGMGTQSSFHYVWAPRMTLGCCLSTSATPEVRVCGPLLLSLYSYHPELLSQTSISMFLGILDLHTLF